MSTDVLVPPTDGNGQQEAVIRLAQAALDEIRKNFDEAAIAQIRENGVRLVAAAEAIEIKTPEDFIQANDQFLGVAQYDRAGLALIEPQIKAAHSPWKFLCDVRQEFKQFSDKARTIYQQKINVWNAAQELARRQEQERKDRERREAEARERARLDQLAADERAKAKKAADDAAEKARAQKEEADRLAAEGRKKEAEKLARAADHTLAKGVQAEQQSLARAEDHQAAAAAVSLPPTFVSPPAPKSTVSERGTTVGQQTWEASITDEHEFVKAVAEGRLPLSCLNLDIDRALAGIKRWAKVEKISTTYEANGILVVPSKLLQARTNSRGTEQR